MTGNKRKVHLVSLGCAKNLVDSEILTGGLKKSAIALTQEPDDADIMIINTCGFLDQAREESIDTILAAGEWKQREKARQLIVMGCLSERYPVQLKKELPEVDYFFGSSEHTEILKLLTGKDYSRNDPMFLRSLLTPSHYAYVKIAEGCDNGCSFCSIPQMRGLQVSRPMNSIITEVAQLQENGVKEFLIIAQDTTSYGWDLTPKISLSDLLDGLDQVLSPTSWLRLHYAHPAHLSHKIIDALARNRVLVPYLDIPVQHAADSVLTSMRRGLNREGIKRRIKLLR
ncbi:MAG: MiaB/RimO family radical SAM methylthiotransferase, partial [FCB group bacterium]|nr:MiaB/RimO family radical SAM methylthiotransferase [FCB group bacterium]